MSITAHLEQRDLGHNSSTFKFYLKGSKSKSFIICIFQSHYQDLGSKSVDDAFDEDWKQEVESKIRECCIMSSACEDSILDREIEPAEIARCLHSLKTIRLEGVMG